MDVVHATVELTGKSGLLMNQDTLADPLHPKTKAFKRISGKKTKTDADHEEMARLEYMAELYADEDGVVSIPGRNIMKCLVDGARVTKSGAKVERGLSMYGAWFPLDYKGPTTPESLYADKNFVSRMTVKVGVKRVVRCRPIFRRWGLVAHVLVDPAVLSLEELQDIATTAGQLIGLGDYRRLGGFGRFDAKVSAS